MYVWSIIFLGKIFYKGTNMERPLVYQLFFTLTDANNSEVLTGEGRASLNERSIEIEPSKGNSISIPYFEVLKIFIGDYSVTLNLKMDEKLVLTRLGYEYENFLTNLYRLRNELLLKYMLMEEKNLAAGIEAYYRYDGEESRKEEGPCEARVYESALVTLPKRSEPIRIPICYVRNFTSSDYTSTIESEADTKLELSRMGEKSSFFERSFTKAIGEVSNRTQRHLSEVAPMIDQSRIRGAATLMSDGKAASRKELESISPELWSQIESRLKTIGMQEEYSFLDGLSTQKNVWVGLKRGLMGDRTGEYIWFVVPIYDSDPKNPGNAVVLEASSDTGTGRATYFFRLQDRATYGKGIELGSLSYKADQFVKRTNQCMIEINFRREPIYLDDQKLVDPEYEMYLYAAKTLTSLKFLREHYIGRVMHSSQEQWKNDTLDLLKFNVESNENTEKWKKYSN